MASKHIGSSFDDFLEEEEIFQEVDAMAVKRVLAFQIQKEMEEKAITKSAMAKLMKTSRGALDRLLDPKNTSVTLHTMDRAASVLGKHIKLTLV